MDVWSLVAPVWRTVYAPLQEYSIARFCTRPAAHQGHGTASLLLGPGYRARLGTVLAPRQVWPG